MITLDKGRYDCIIVVLSDWSETNLNTLKLITCQTLKMWAEAKCSFFFLLPQERTLYLFLA
jgi:hypothetical protein